MHGGPAGAPHKQWLLDQVVRLLAPDYDQWVATFEDAEGDTWDEGTPPEDSEKEDDA